jgi:hypothetical protein
MSAKNQSFVLNESIATEISSTVKSTVTSDKKWRKLGEHLVGAGVTRLMLDKPGKGKDNPFQSLHEQINSHIVLGFDSDVQKLINTPAKDTGKLSQSDQAVRSYWKKQIASLFSKIKAHVDNIENPKESRAKNPMSDEGKAIEALKKAKVILQKIESAQFDVTATIKSIDQALALIK